MHFKKPKQQPTVLFLFISCNFEQVSFIIKQKLLLFSKACRLETNNIYQTLVRWVGWVESFVDFNTKIWLQNLTWLLFDFISQKPLCFCVERRRIKSMKIKYINVVDLGILNCPLIILYYLTKTCTDSTKQLSKVQ